MGLFSFLFSCNDSDKKTVTETFHVDGDTITTVSTENGNLYSNYQLSELTLEQKKHLEEKLKEAELFITKYNGELPTSKYDANILDLVFEKWLLDKNTKKESPEYVIEAMGAALGQDIVNNLDCDWQVLTDQYGSDLTVIHKKYKVNGFPFSSAEKAYTENKIGSFQTIKLTLKHHIQDAEKNGNAQERK